MKFFLWGSRGLGPLWANWVVHGPGKKPVWFEHWYAAAIFAVYVARNPVAMEDAV